MSVTRDAWAAMSTDHATPVGMLRRRILAHQPRNLFVGMTQPEMRRVLILSVETSAIGATPSPRGTRAVSCTLQHHDDGRSEFLLTLEIKDISDVFATFADDVADAVSRQPDDAAAVSALFDRFEVWRELLSGRGPIGLTGPDAQGLWAELWIMEYFLHPAWGSGTASCWTASAGDDKDFRRGNLSVEVKSTTRKAPVTVDISNEYQLDTVGDEALMLAVVELSSSETGGGESLSERVDACRAVLDPADAAIMTDHLQERGYDDETVTGERYVLRACTWYRVEPGFPRLVASDLPAGVGSLSYQVTLDVCQPWRIDDSQVGELLQPAGHAGAYS